jgi:FAD:protein FMN transferase
MRLCKFEFTAMASANEIQLYADDDATAKRQAQSAIDEVQRIERKYSRYRADSLLSEINAAAGKAAIRVDDETAALLDYGAACYNSSGGLFDLTSGVLRRCWNFREPALPDPAQLKATLKLVGWNQVRWRRPEIKLTKAGMELDFGGIGKEYAADRAAQACLDAGAQFGLVNLGGDVRIFGPHPDGSPWQIGIAHPRAESQALARITLTSGALATSGDYERYFVLDGRRYCHVLNPRTGYPVAAMQSVSVIAPLCLVAGSLSTIAMLHQHEAQRFLQKENVPYLVVDQNGKITASGVETIAATKMPDGTNL